MVRRNSAFTLIEVLLVVILLGIASYVAIGAYSGNVAPLRTSAASSIVMTDLLYAQNLATASCAPVYVVFQSQVSGQYPGYDLETKDTNGQYQAVSSAGRGVWQLRFNDPTRSILSPSVRLTTVTATSPDSLGTPPVLSFDALGRPCSGSNTVLVNAVTLTLTDVAGRNAVTITIQPASGEVSAN